MTLIKNLADLPFQPPKNLIGRTDLLAQIEEQITAKQAVFLYGIAGVGKTAIAATLAAQRIQKGQAVLWLQADTLEKILRQILWLYEIRADEDIAAQVASVLKKYQPFVILSGFETHEAATRFVWACTKNQLGVLLIHETASDGPWEPILVRRLGYSDSQQLFTSIAQKKPAELSGFLSYCDGHPLIIELVARQMASQSLDLGALVSKLPTNYTSHRQRVMAVIDAAFHTLDISNQGLLLALCANFAHGISADLIRVLINTSLGIAQQLSQNIAKLGFVTIRQVKDHTYYQIHPLIQTFAVEELRSNKRYIQAKNRILEAMVTFARYSNPSRELFVLEIDNFIGAAKYAIETNKPDSLHIIVKLLNQQKGLIERRGHGEEVQGLAAHLKDVSQVPEDVIVGEVVEENAPQVVAPPGSEFSLRDTDIRNPLESTVLQELNSTALIPADSPLISCQALALALKGATTRQDRPEMGRLSMEVGRCHAERQDYPQAFHYYQQALLIFQDIGDVAHLLVGLENLALLSQLLEGPEQTLKYTRRGFNIARQLSDNYTSARFLSLSGDAFVTLGDTHNAMNAYKQAIKVYRGIEAKEETGIALGKLAAIYMDLGRNREAAAALSQAISLFEEIGRKDLQGRALGNLGTALGYLGRWHEAGQRHTAALQLARELRDVEEERFQLRNLAYVAETEGYINWAVNYNRQALHLAISLRDGEAISTLTFELGRLLAAEDETMPQAEILLQRSVELKPHPEAMRLLENVREQLQKSSKKYPAETDIYTYAAEAYPKADSKKRQK